MRSRTIDQSKLPKNYQALSHLFKSPLSDAVVNAAFPDETQNKINALLTSFWLASEEDEQQYLLALKKLQLTTLRIHLSKDTYDLLFNRYYYNKAMILEKNPDYEEFDHPLYPLNPNMPVPTLAKNQLLLGMIFLFLSIPSLILSFYGLVFPITLICAITGIFTVIGAIACLWNSFSNFYALHTFTDAIDYTPFTNQETYRTALEANEAIHSDRIIIKKITALIESNSVAHLDFSNCEIDLAILKGIEAIIKNNTTISVTLPDINTHYLQTERSLARITIANIRNESTLNCCFQTTYSFFSHHRKQNDLPTDVVKLIIGMFMELFSIDKTHQFCTFDPIGKLLRIHASKPNSPPARHDNVQPEQESRILVIDEEETEETYLLKNN